MNLAKVEDSSTRALRLLNYLFWDPWDIFGDKDKKKEVIIPDEMLGTVPLALYKYHTAVAQERTG